MSGMAEALAEAHAELRMTEAVPTTKPSFESLGLDAAFMRAVQKAYPNVKTPTDTQAQLISAILGTQDILVKDVTGSGKCVDFDFDLVFLFSTCPGSGRLG